MIRNGVGYAKLIFNGVVSMAGNFNTKSLFAGTPYVPAVPVLADGPRIVAEMKALSQFATLAHFTTRASAAVQGATSRVLTTPAPKGRLSRSGSAVLQPTPSSRWCAA